MSLLSVSTWSKRSEKRKKQMCEADERIFKDEAVGCFMVTDLWLNTRVSNQELIKEQRSAANRARLAAGNVRSLCCCSPCPSLNIQCRTHICGASTPCCRSSDRVTAAETDPCCDPVLRGTEPLPKIRESASLLTVTNYMLTPDGSLKGQLLDSSGQLIFAKILSRRKEASAHVSAQTQPADGISVPHGGTSFSLASYVFPNSV